MSLDNSRKKERTQHFNLRVKLIKQKTVVKTVINKVKELSDNESVERLHLIEKLTDKEYESDRAFLFKEIGSEILQFDFNEYRDIKKIIENKRKINENILNYESFLKILADKTREFSKTNGVKKPKPYSEMPIFKTVKRLGEGDFGSAYLIVKKDRRKRFQLEDELNFEEENMYVLKYQTFTTEDNYSEYPESFAKQISNKINSMLKTCLKSEIEASFLLSHPNIAKFYGCYVTNYFCLFVHEYVCCGPIKHLLEAKEEIILKKRVKFVTAQIVSALEYLHELRLVHGDLHVGNVCTDYRGYVKLIDFGMCTSFDEPIRDDRHILTFIANRHLEHLKSRRNSIEKLHLRPNESIKLLLGNIDNIASRYSIDTMSLAKIFYSHYKLMTDMEDEKDMFFCCAGLKEEDFENVYLYPTMKQLREGKYFNEIDFKKLLSRGYNLEMELEIDCQKMFENYSKIQHKLEKFTHVKYNRVFPFDTKYSFCKKNDLNYIRENYAEYSSSFRDLN